MSSPTLVLLAAAAAANLTLGITLALRDPARASDVWTMYGWCRAWLLDGQRLYTTDSLADYPPNAIVMLAPLVWLPERWVLPIWTMVTLALTPLLAYLIVRTVRPRITWREAIAPILLFLCWGGARTFLEFSRLSLTLAFAAVLLADSRATASGMCLGLALFKPHIAGPIALWLVATRRIRVAVVAAAIVIAGVAVYCLRVQANPLVELAGYWRILNYLYGGAEGLMGWTSLREWAHAATATSASGDASWLAAAAVLLLLSCAMAAGARGQREAAPGFAALSALCLWSLLTFYHIGNNFILMLPAFVFLWSVDDPPTRRPRLWWLVWIEIVLIVDVPLKYIATAEPWATIVDNLDRVVVLLTFVFVVVLWRRARVREHLAHPASLRTQATS